MYLFIIRHCGSQFCCQITAFVFLLTEVKLLTVIWGLFFDKRGFLFSKRLINFIEEINNLNLWFKHISKSILGLKKMHPIVSDNT